MTEFINPDEIESGDVPITEGTRGATSSANSSSRSFSPKKLLITLLKLAVLATVALWLVLQLRKSWTELLNYSWAPRYEWLAASGIFYLIGFFPAALFWFLSLRWFGQRPTFFKSVLAYYSSQLGKYVPGKAMVIIIRTGMIASDKVRVSLAAASVFYETLVMMGSGAFIGALIVLFCFRENAFFSLMALGVAVCSVTPLLPPVFVRVMKFLKVGKDNPNVQNALKSLKFSYLLIGFALMSVLWFFLGLSLWAVIYGIGITPEPLLETLPRYIASVSLAMSLGFVVVVSPGGLGVREAILSKLLIPYIALILANPANAMFNLAPETVATVISLVQRIVSIAAELAIFAAMSLVGVWLKRKVRQS